MLRNQLVMADLNHEVVGGWLQRGEELRSDFELGFWDGSYPEHDIEAIANLHLVMNDMPRGELELEDEVFTPEILRERERTLAERQTERWSAFVRESASGELVGFSEVFWTPQQPQELHQGDTGVSPRYRQRGIGGWLKAAMIERVQRKRPQVQRIHTWNADSNEPMLRVNYAMGFKLQVASAHWQVSVADLLKYLDSRP
jgi:RimJ/RimL family protein N-acetyltransferase